MSDAIKSIGSLPFLKYWSKCVNDASCAEPKLIREAKIAEERSLNLQYCPPDFSPICPAEPSSESDKSDILNKEYDDSVFPVCIPDFEMTSEEIQYEQIRELKKRITGSCAADENIRILIAPFRIRKRNPSSKSAEPNKYFYPFWYTVYVEKGGQLSAPKYSHPFISRKYLSPSDSSASPFTIGAAIKYDGQCSQFNNNIFNSFQDYIAAVNTFFFEITGFQINEYHVEGLTRENTATIVLNDGFSASHNIIRLYNYIIDTARDPAKGISPLLDNLIRGYEGERLNAITPEEFNKYEYLISGTVSKEEEAWKKKESSDSQKSALYSWFNDTDEKILAVTGPPGTGKTFLLKNLVANSMIRAALDERVNPEPEFLIAAAGSNQAVQNIIECLQDCSDHRWLPDAPHFLNTNGLSTKIGGGTFLASKSADESKYQFLQKYLFIQDFSNGSFCLYETKEYVSYGKNEFIRKFHEEYGLEDKTSIDEIIDFLRNELAEQVDLIMRLEDKHYLNVCRLKAFKIALHYWEGRWLAESNEHIGRGISSIKDFRRRWKWRAMLTPCFAGTFYTIPDVFLFKEKTEAGIDYKYLTEFANTLIVDEAGQVTPEIGAPTFSFAKRAIVLGDAMQLEPIWDICPEIDKCNLKIYDITSNSIIEALKKSGHLCSSGNLMTLSQNATWIKDEIQGIPLKEHYRCYDEIIRFCDELCYGYISPQRGPSPYTNGPEDCDEPLPPFQIIPVYGNSQYSKGHSQRNDLECFAIREWIEYNEKQIPNKYCYPDSNTKIKYIQDAIAILTPYRAQVSKISEILQGEGYSKKNKKREYDGLENLLFVKDDDGNEHRMVVGTVHSLQGSQRPIILYSSVLSNEDGLSFIDKHMLNVAVSRARNSFIAFSNPSIFEKNKDYPITTLNSYYQELIKLHPEYILDNSHITADPMDFKWKKRIFISYRHDDREIAQRITRSLLDYGYNPNTVFFDEISIDVGDPFPQIIREGIKQCTSFILLHSKKSDIRCAEVDDWVAKEISLALSNQKCRIFPISLDGFKSSWDWISDEAQKKKMREISIKDYKDDDKEYKSFIDDLIRAMNKKNDEKNS